MKKFNEFKTRGTTAAQKSQKPGSRLLTPNNQKRSPSKNRQSVKKKSNIHLSAERSPSDNKELNGKAAEAAEDREESVPKTTNLQELGFLKEKLLICCNVIRKRLKSTEEKIDKKKGLRTDRVTAGTILIEERSFLLRHPKNVS